MHSKNSPGASSASRLGGWIVVFVIALLLLPYLLGGGHSDGNHRGPTSASEDRTSDDRASDDRASDDHGFSQELNQGVDGNVERPGDVEAVLGQP
jgi:hypothetical protein